MRRQHPSRSPFLRRVCGLSGLSDARAPAVAAAVAMPLMLASLLLPLPLVLPALSLWSLTVAGLFALIGWLRPSPHPDQQVTAWDIAGAFTLIGCAAAIIGEIEHMVEFLWSQPSRSRAYD